MSGNRIMKRAVSRFPDEGRKPYAGFPAEASEDLLADLIGGRTRGFGRGFSAPRRDRWGCRREGGEATDGCEVPRAVRRARVVMFAAWPIPDPLRLGEQSARPGNADTSPFAGHFVLHRRGIAPWTSH
jgi:hypothetical protein